ncbi:MAG: ABC transporter substrate-binding protein [Bradyrhizobiaceae bacterium]|nr:ABC transporter substrate-binding protein [Bradyrhizobiaceae bacterium]
MHRKSRALLASFVITAAATGLAGNATAQDTYTIGLPGIPPVFVNTQAYVAEQQGLFKKHGVNVTLRPFDSGAAAARAVASGNIQLSMSPSPLVVTMVSNNPDAGLAMIYGYEKPDWLIGSLDPGITKCEDVKGKPVGVDSLGGARSIALNVMLRQCNLKAEETQQVPLSANVLTAMISGQIPVGVLHIDDVPIIERESKKKVIPIVDINDVQKINHYLALVTSKKMIAEKRADLVKIVAAYIEAERFMRDPKNIDAVAKAAAPTSRSEPDAKWAIEQYVKMEFWPREHGLKKENVDSIIATQKKVGNIKGDPVPYAGVVDLSVYEEAVKLVK